MSTLAETNGAAIAKLELPVVFSLGKLAEGQGSPPLRVNYSGGLGILRLQSNSWIMED